MPDRETNKTVLFGDISYMAQPHGHYYMLSWRTCSALNSENLGCFLLGTQEGYKDMGFFSLSFQANGRAGMSRYFHGGSFTKNGDDFT